MRVSEIEMADAAGGDSFALKKNTSSPLSTISSPTIDDFIPNDQGVEEHGSAKFKGESSIMSSFINLINTILGTGVLGVPYGYSETGWVLGAIFFLTFATFSATANYFLAECALHGKSSPCSFYSVAKAAFPKWAWVIDASVVLNTFGGSTSYLIVFSNTIPDVLSFFGATGAALNRQLWVFIAWLIVAPLCCLRNLDALKFTSGMSVLAVFFIVVLTLAFAGASDNDTGSSSPLLMACGDGTEQCKGDTTNFALGIGTGRVLGIFAFGFICSVNIFSVVNELRSPSIQRVSIVVNMTVWCAFIVYVCVGVAGYYTYGDKIRSDILLNYPKNGLTSAARLFVAALCVFSYPVLHYPGRKCIISLLNLYYGTVTEKGEDELSNSPFHAEEGEGPSSSRDRQGGSETKDTSVESSPTYVFAGFDTKMSPDKIQYWAVTATFLVLSLILALITSHLGTILAFVGASSGSLVSFILPGFAYWYTLPEGHPNAPPYKRYFALFQGVVGCILMPVGLVFIFL